MIPAHIEYAQRQLRRRRAAALTKLLTGEHIEAVATEVVGYADDATPERIAENILRYLAHELLEPLMPEQGDDRG